MQDPTSPILPVIVFAVALVIISVVVSVCKRTGFTSSLPGTVTAALPGVVLLGLFCFLPLHMHQVLGGWPAVIGDRDFPANLAFHSQLYEKVFLTLLGATLLVWPVVFVVCAVRRSWLVRYMGVYGLAIFIGFFGMAIALALSPKPFQNWWWD